PGSILVQFRLLVAGIDIDLREERAAARHIEQQVRERAETTLLGDTGRVLTAIAKRIAVDGGNALPPRSGEVLSSRIAGAVASVEHVVLPGTAATMPRVGVDARDLDGLVEVDDVTTMLRV